MFTGASSRIHPRTSHAQGGLGTRRGGPMSRDDVVTRAATPVPARHALRPKPVGGSAFPSTLRLVAPPENKHRWRRAGFALAPVTVFIDVSAAVTAWVALSLSSWWSLLLALLVLTLNCAGGHYRARIAPSLLDELPSLVGRGLVAGAIATGLRAFGDLPVHDGLVNAAVLFIALAVAGRVVAYPLVRIYRRSGGKGDPTVIVGCGKIGGKLATTLLDHPEYGLWPVGYVD